MMTFKQSSTSSLASFMAIGLVVFLLLGTTMNVITPAAAVSGRTYTMRFKFLANIQSVEPRKDNVRTAVTALLHSFGAILDQSKFMIHAHGISQTLVTSQLSSPLYNTSQLRTLVANKLESTMTGIMAELSVRVPTFNLHCPVESRHLSEDGASPEERKLKIVPAIDVTVNVHMKPSEFRALPTTQLYGMAAGAIDTFFHLAKDGTLVIHGLPPPPPPAIKTHLQQEHSFNALGDNNNSNAEDTPTDISFSMQFDGDIRPLPTIIQACDGEMAIRTSPIKQGYDATAMRIVDSQGVVDPYDTPRPQVPNNDGESKKNEDDQEELDKMKQTNIILGVVLGVALFAVAFALVSVLIRRRNPAYNGNGSTASDTYNETNSLDSAEQPMLVVHQHQNQPNHHHRRSATERSTASSGGHTHSQGETMSTGGSSGDSPRTLNNLMANDTKPLAWRMPTMEEVHLDEKLVIQEAETNCQSWSVAIPCAKKHFVEKAVTVSCNHKDGKKPKKATDLKTLFGAHIGHVWKCAKHDNITLQDYQHTNPAPIPEEQLKLQAAAAANKKNKQQKKGGNGGCECEVDDGFEITTNDPYLQQRHTLRKISVSVCGTLLPNATRIVYNTVPLTFDAVAKCLRDVDTHLTTVCPCETAKTQPKPGKLLKVEVLITMELLEGNAKTLNANPMDDGHEVVYRPTAPVNPIPVVTGSVVSSANSGALLPPPSPAPPRQYTTTHNPYNNSQYYNTTTTTTTSMTSSSPKSVNRIAAMYDDM